MKASLVILFGCALGAATPVAHANGNADARKQILAFYTLKDAAERTNNFAAWKALAAHNILPTFTLTLSDGKVLSLPQVLVGLSKSMARGAHPIKDKTTLLHLTVNGGAATEQSTAYRAGILLGARGPVRHYTETDTYLVKWVKQGSVWKTASVQTVGVSRTLDGKPFMPRK